VVRVEHQDAKQVLELKANEISVILDSGAAIKVVGKDGAAVTTMGDGAVHAAVVEALEQFYTGSLKPYIEAIFVNTSMGPSATVLISVGSAPTWDSNINSTKLEFPDG